MSLDSQESAARSLLVARGYEVPPEYVLKVDWTSLDLMACPDFQQLRGWIAKGQIHAIGVSDRDRLQAQGLQRLIFLSECRELGVQIITVQGPPMLDGAEGQPVELALALGKEKSVLRAQQGAKNGLRDRVKLHGLPATGFPPYGYKFRMRKGVAKKCLSPLSPTLTPTTLQPRYGVWPWRDTLCAVSVFSWRPTVYRHQREAPIGTQAPSPGFLITQFTVAVSSGSVRK